MGIRHLTTFLRPYAPVKPLDAPLVIDGSAFAHHIYGLCLGRRCDARNALEAVPSYLELQEAAIGWLNGLRKYNVVIQKIYFDGFLPPSKVKTRLERLIKGSSQLSEYHNTHARPCSPPISGSNEPISLFSTKNAPPKLTAIPSLPFTVPAILQALLDSENFRDITTVVPDEADLFCADFVKRHGGIILTGDSDFLVHDIGETGGVCFLSQPLEDKYGKLCGPVYYPASITKQLDLPEVYGLRSLAFEITIELHGSFKKLLLQAKSSKAIDSNPAQYAEFLKEYAGVDVVSHSSTLEGTTHSVYETLDPRISEYVLQFPSQARLAGCPRKLEFASQEPFHMFLPPLLDCPARTTGWEVSSATRQLAYGLMNIVLSEDEMRSTVYEHRKQQAKSSGRELQLPTLGQVSQAALAFGIKVSRLREVLPQLHRSQIWIALALCEDVYWAHAHEKTSLSAIAAKEFEELQAVKPHKRLYSWDLIQFFSQIQATLYSFRILEQISKVVASCRNDYGMPLPELFSTIPLPRFSDYADRGNSDLLFEEIRPILKAVHAVLEIEYDEPVYAAPIANKSEKKERKRARIEAQESAGDSKRQKNTNPFELLVVE